MPTPDSPAAGRLSPLAEIESALLAVDRLKAEAVVRRSCTAEGPFPCIEALIVPALEEIGRQWETGEVALSQVYMSGRICEEIVDGMLPQGDPRRVNQPPMAIAVLEDHHTLGKRIVLSVLRAGGYEVTDYGAGISAEQLAEHVKKDRTKILLISTLMLPAALRCRDAITRIRQENPGIRIIVGGAPFRFDPVLWKEIGADAMGASASDTLALVKQMAGEVH